MSDACFTRTVCCKLRVDSTGDTALRETQAAINAAATDRALVAWEQHITNKNTLHHVVYAATRAQFGLGAQLACCARNKAAEAVRAARANHRDTCPSFRTGSGYVAAADMNAAVNIRERAVVNLPTVSDLRVQGKAASL